MNLTACCVIVVVACVGREVVEGLVLAVVQAVTVQQHHLVQGSLEKFVVILQLWKDSFVFWF